LRIYRESLGSLTPIKGDSSDTRDTYLIVIDTKFGVFAIKDLTHLVLFLLNLLRSEERYLSLK
jgi:hypothetical protein